ncbi:hypothetical protein CRG98_021099 [Punica granatum]|uniref:Uncharacterized protein n=1 Tax=Punica granatum TaxID=22663 RepID=A0A2I0JQD4_PUNGR|nr:hypothetical protein CRG98_021099 [Punica granatum]
MVSQNGVLTVMNSVLGLGQKSSCGKPVGQNGVLTACPSLVACSMRGGRSPRKAVKWTRSPWTGSPESSKVTRPKPEESGKMDVKSGKQ